MKLGRTCPQCRSAFDRLFKPLVDCNVQKQIRDDLGIREFEEKKEALIQAGKWEEHKLTFTYGNTYEYDEIGRPAVSSKTKMNNHRWTMFIACNELRKDKDMTDMVVKSVTYHLHETFRPNIVQVT